MIRRTVLAAALVAPALALFPAAPASAGCVDDYAANLTSGGSDYVFPSPSPTTWVTASGLVVTVDGADVVYDVSRLALLPVVIGVDVAGEVAGDTSTFVGCVV